MDQVNPPLVEWGTAASALPGQVVSGDRCIVAPFPEGVLAAVVDGLGHGDAASLAAEIACATLARYAGEHVLSLIQRCHESLARTRGVVMSLASFNARDNTVTWAGVGNVEGVLLWARVQANRRRETILLRGGVVGYNLPPLRASTLGIARGDTLILVTDGIRGAFAENVDPADPPQEIAGRILKQYGKQTDDALVLVARYLGGIA